MANKYFKTIKRKATEWKLSEFLRNFAAVVLGIVITFVGSDMIESHNKRNEISKAMRLLKEELLINQEQIKAMMNLETFEKNGALYLFQNKDSLNQVSPDSLAKYSDFAFQKCVFLPITDAMEMLQSSSLMQHIDSKDLTIQIIKTYNIIKGAFTTINVYTEMKSKYLDSINNNKEIQDFLTKNESNISPLLKWEFLFRQTEGLAYIKSICNFHDNPNRMYGRYIDFISETISAIDKEYN